MTPEQELALLKATAAGLEEDLQAAYRRLIELIESGVPPRDAVTAVMESFSGEMAGTMATALSGILQQSVGTAAVLQLEVGRVRLSRKLYAEGAQVSEVVQGIVDRHTKGFIDARKLALSLFEGYAFRPPDQEPLKMRPTNPQLPKYLREALLTDGGIQAQMARAYARIQVNGLRTPELRAAYSQLLDAIDRIEAGRGKVLLDKRVQVAFFERMRYFSQRIALTELHRAYSQREARLIMRDDEVEFVQVVRAPGGAGEPCICVLMTQRDRYGLGPGIYPKGRAPVPAFHPHCLPGDTLITSVGRVSAVSKRWFDGDLAVITTSSGKRLSATVNHPILTRRGWVGAGFLDVGDEVISRLDAVTVGGDVVIDDKHQHVPSSIAEIADAFFASGQVAAVEVPVAAEHFHGDGVGSDVAVIGTDRELWDRVDAAASEVADHHPLKVADAGTACLLGDGVGDLGGEGLLGASDSGVRVCSKCGALIGGQRPHSDQLLLAACPESDSALGEDAVDDLAANAELASKIQNGATGPVFADEIVSVERVPFRGHVYNVETDEGHYSANGIVTHNCRCKLVPRGDLKGKRAKDEDQDADAYFLDRLGEQTAARVMGSRAKRDQVLAGTSADAVYNASIDPAYRVKTMAEV